LPSSRREGEPLTDEQLLAKHCRGEFDALELLIERYRDELYGFLTRFVNSRAAAEDLFQETFIQIHVAAATFDPERRFRPWLFTIAANKARDFLRKHRREQSAALSAPLDDDEGPSFVDLMEADLPLPPIELERRELEELVASVIARLPDHQREVLLLAYFQQFAYKEIARQLDVPLGTVKSRLHAAVAAFAKLWKDEFGDVHPQGPEPD
jgi:RNA polymerase sigma-70 factor (ECF subfamily)